MNYKPAASTQQAPMAIAPPRAACRPSFTFLLCCDRCQADPASILTFNDRQLLCKTCDVAVHAGKSELEAPRFKINAKCLPKLAAAARNNSQPAAARPPTLPSPPKAMLEADDDLLMDLEAPQPAPGGQLIDFEWWPGSLAPPDANQPDKSAASSACQDADPPIQQEALYSALNAPMIHTYTIAGPEQTAGFPLFSPEAPQSPVRSEYSSGQSTCCSNGDGFPAAANPFLQPVGTSLLDSGAGDMPSESFVRMCVHCGVTKTPQWRAGPLGQKTLCNACGVRFKAGRLTPVVSYPPPGYPSGAVAALTAIPKSAASLAAKKVAPSKPGITKRKHQLGTAPRNGVHPLSPALPTDPKKAKSIACSDL